MEGIYSKEMTFYKKTSVIVSAILIFLVIMPIPQVTGHILFDIFEFPKKIQQLESLLIVFFNTVTVFICFLFFPKKSNFKFQPIRRPFLLLIILPIAFLNFVKGPFKTYDFYRILFLVSTNFLVGFYEEFCFRGIIQTHLEALGESTSILIAALIFGLSHFNYGFIYVLGMFIIGLLFSTVRDQVGIWPLIIVHFFTEFNLRFNHQ